MNYQIILSFDTAEDMAWAAIQLKDLKPVSIAPEEKKEKKEPEVIEAPQADQAPVAAPVEAPIYTLDQLANAGARIMDTVGPAPLTDLNKRFGVGSLRDLPQDQYGPYAEALKELGATL
jgi:hypothetical protein